MLQLRPSQHSFLISLSSGLCSEHTLTVAFLISQHLDHGDCRDDVSVLRRLRPTWRRAPSSTGFHRLTPRLERLAAASDSNLPHPSEKRRDPKTSALSRSE